MSLELRMNSHADVFVFVTEMRRAFGPDRCELLRGAATSGMFMRGRPRASEDGSVTTAVSDPLAVPFRRGPFFLTLRQEPLPRITCSCEHARSGERHCMHMCWLLLRGGLLNVEEYDFDEFWDASILHVHHRLRDIVSPSGPAEPPGPPSPPPRSHDDVRPPDSSADCPICYGPFEEAACVRCSACPAHFHRSCATQWAKSCPMCRDPGQFADLRQRLCLDSKALEDQGHLIRRSIDPTLTLNQTPNGWTIGWTIDGVDYWESNETNEHHLVRAQIGHGPASSSPPPPPSPPSSTLRDTPSQPTSIV